MTVWIYVPHFTFICCFVLLVIPGNDNPDCVSAVLSIPSTLLINLRLWILDSSVALVLEGGQLIPSESWQWARLCPRYDTMSYEWMSVPSGTAPWPDMFFGAGIFFHFLLCVTVCWPLRWDFLRMPQFFNYFSRLYLLLCLVVLRVLRKSESRDTVLKLFQNLLQ